jgi:hypothetical protein
MTEAQRCLLWGPGVCWDAAKYQRRVELTCDVMSVAGRLAAGDEDDIPLACICVLVLEKEEIVDAVIAQGRGLDHDTKRAG